MSSKSCLPGILVLLFPSCYTTKVVEKLRSFVAKTKNPPFGGVDLKSRCGPLLLLLLECWM